MSGYCGWKTYALPEIETVAPRANAASFVVLLFAVMILLKEEDYRGETFSGGP